MNDPAASGGVSTKATINFNVASNGELDPELRIKLARKFAEADSMVSNEGERGAGKKVFAQAIHSARRRRKGPFVAVNCGAIPDSILDSELFGYQAGAFTGARRLGKDGLFTRTHTGTIFLDEISETSPRFQTTLLRVIQEMEVRPLGSDRVNPIDIRIIAATNRQLKQEVDLGNFGSDLYYRLNILRLNISPLGYRKSDIPPFVRHFIGYNGAKLGKGISSSRQAMNCIKNYPWRGNIRQLQNAIERMCVTCNLKIGEALVTETLDDYAGDNLQGTERIDCIRKNHIAEVLKQCGNNKKLAAEKLGISRTTLWRELKSNNQTIPLR